MGFTARRETSQSEEEAYRRMRDKVLDELKRTFRPEFLNRVDAVIVFRSLNREQIQQIVDLELGKVCERLKEHDLSLQATDAAKELLAERGYEPQFGARPLRRVIQQLVEDPLSEGVLAGQFQQGDHILVDVENGQITLRALDRETEVATSSPA